MFLLFVVKSSINYKVIYSAALYWCFLIEGSVVCFLSCFWLCLFESTKVIWNLCTMMFVASKCFPVIDNFLKMLPLASLELCQTKSSCKKFTLLTDYIYAYTSNYFMINGIYRIFVNTLKLIHVLWMSFLFLILEKFLLILTVVAQELQMSFKEKF